MKVFKALLLSVALFGGCVTSNEPGETGESEQAIFPVEACCSWGSYTCSVDASIGYDYDPPGCGTLTKPRAKAVCQAACGATCIDSGWYNGCTKPEPPIYEEPPPGSGL